MGYPGFGKIIMMTRFDLRRAKHDVRYVNIDTGPAYEVVTDDWSIFGGIEKDAATKYRLTATERLLRYGDLFSVLASMI